MSHLSDDVETPQRTSLKRVLMSFSETPDTRPEINTVEFSRSLQWSYVPFETLSGKCTCLLIAGLSSEERYQYMKLSSSFYIPNLARLEDTSGLSGSSAFLL